MGWTEQQVQTLKKMWGNGYSASDIAKNLGGGVTRNAVIGKAHRLKLSAAAGMSRSVPQPPSKTAGVAMTKIKKVSSKRTALRGMPPVQQVSDVASSIKPRTALARPLETTKRTEGIPVTKAGEHHCRWPIGDPRSPDFRFCGCEALEGFPYCADHARVAYQTVSRRARANANVGSSEPGVELRLIKKTE